MPKVYLSRREEFSSAHRLFSSQLTLEENRRVFGKCLNKHGHNYVCEVVVAGEPDSVSGMVMNLVDLKAIIQAQVMDILDHKDLEEDVEYFKTTPSTAENLAVFIWNQMATGLGDKAHLMAEVRLWETPKNLVTYRGE